MRNLASDPAHSGRVKAMMSEIWDRLRTTGDRTLLESHYFSLRLGVVGPNRDGADA